MSIELEVVDHWKEGPSVASKNSSIDKAGFTVIFIHKE